MQDTTAAAGYRSGDYLVIPVARSLLRGETPIELEGKVFDLVLLLISHHERALGKQEIVTALWGHRPVTDAALSQLIYKARRAFNDDGERQTVIRTIYGHGLQWVAPVETVNPLPPVPPSSSAAEPASPALSSPVAAGTSVESSIPARPRTRARQWAPAVIAIVVACAAIAGWVILQSGAQPASHLPRIALLPIENATHDTTQDWVSRGIPGLIGSLLGQSDGIDVIDPLQVARAWDFTVPPGGNRTDHTRATTGATIVIGGKLSKLANLYQLTLQVDRGNHGRPPEIVLTGVEPGALAIAAVSRIRQALQMESPAVPMAGPSPKDPYLAQTLARGMDAAMRGRWADAKPYFALCSREALDFLPCRLRMGQAQAHSDQLPQARQTLQSALAQAHARGDSHAAAQALTGLADIGLIQNHAADALQQLQQAAPFARQAGDVELQTSIALKSANAAAVLKRTALAEQELGRARRLIATHHLQETESALHNSESFVAYSRGDFAAAATADRKALAASLAIGDEFGATADTHNLALALMRADRSLEALPLFAETFRRGSVIGNTEVRFSSGNNLATILLEAGLYDRARPVIDQLVKTATEQKSATWQAYALSLRSDQQWGAGKSAEALADARKAAALADAKQDPWLATMLQFKTALIASFEDRDSLPGLSTRFDAMVGAQPHPGDYAYWQQLVHALAAAASGDHAAVRATLRKAVAAAHPDDPSSYDVRRAGLAIALTSHDPQAARIALEDFDPARCNVADVLQFASQWMLRQGGAQAVRAAGHRAEVPRQVEGGTNARGQASIAARLAALRQAAIDALGDIDLGLDPAATAP
jgi:DNA-binding winged helix-turn-helix (wHTH) protein